MVVCLIGATGSGKTLITNKLLNLADTARSKLQGSFPTKLRGIMQITTRPMRAGEVDGVDYKFVSDSEFHSLVINNKLAEHRTYATKLGMWSYGTLLDDLITDDIIILPVSLDQYENLVKIEQLKNTESKLNLVPQVIFIDHKIRLHRLIDRATTDMDLVETCSRFSRDFYKESFDCSMFIGFEDFVISNNEDPNSAVCDLYKNIGWIVSHDKEYISTVDVVNKILFRRRDNEVYRNPS